MKLSSTWATRTVAMGPFQGMLETISAADAPMPASTSDGFSPSVDSTVMITCVSHLNDLGNKGRMGLSVSREVSISRSAGRASRLKKPPGIFPPA